MAERELKKELIRYICLLAPEKNAMELEGIDFESLKKIYASILGVDTLTFNMLLEGTIDDFFKEKDEYPVGFAEMALASDAFHPRNYMTEFLDFDSFLIVKRYLTERKEFVLLTKELHELTAEYESTENAIKTCRNNFQKHDMQEDSWELTRKIDSCRNRINKALASLQEAEQEYLKARSEFFGGEGRK